MMMRAISVIAAAALASVSFSPGHADGRRGSVVRGDLSARP